MAVGLLGRKIGMTQIYGEDGNSVGVTVIEAGPCVVLQVRTAERDGYSAVQLGYGEKPRRLATRAERGQVAAIGSKRAKARAEAKIEALKTWLETQIGEEPVHDVLSTVETEAKYAGYISQQERQIERLSQSEERKIPAGFLYDGIPGLSTEVKQKLSRVRPVTLGQARRIPGVTPAAVAVLDVYLSVGAASR